MMKSNWNKKLMTGRSLPRILLIVLSVVLIIFGVLLAGSYKKLNYSVQKERISAVEQIGILLSDKVNQLKSVYIKETEQFADIIEDFDVHTKAELRHTFQDDQFLLVTENGLFQALDGTNWLIEDNVLLNNILNGTGVCSSFASEQMRGDYWLFSMKIRPAVIDGHTVIGVVKPVSAEAYADIATLCFYEGLGEAYVTDNDGVIIMRPQNEATQNVFSGYNLFSILKHENIPEKNIERLGTAIREQKQEQIIADLGGTTWLIQSVPGDYGRGIVVTVPISITAKDTYSGMHQVIALIVLVVLVLAGIITLGLVYILRNNQLEEVRQVKVKAKNDFLDKMSHDIRTPLNAIIGMHELALRSLDNRDALSDYLNKAKCSSEYLISVINDILDMSKIENGKMNISHVTFSMEELLDHVYQMEILAAQSKKLEFRLDIQTVIEDDYTGDPVRIRQCLMNLISNAIKFTHEGGSIDLRYRAENINEQDSLVVLTVQDTGIGMSKDFRSQMFKPFEQENSSMTSSYAGSGLGLAIVGNLVELMGGMIDVASNLGEGSTFTICLPLTRTARKEKNNEKSELKILEQLKGKRILFAEDNELNREIGVSLLTQFGLLVDAAENGKVVLEKFVQSSSGYYSMIFMDIQMPVMNGYDAARNIRSCGHPDSSIIPILALSANAFDEDARKSLESGMQGHLAKPIDMTELMAALKEYIS